MEPTTTQQDLAKLTGNVLSLKNEVVLDPRWSALIIVDMQVDYCSSEGRFALQNKVDVSPNREIIPGLLCLAERFRAAGSHVIFTRMVEIPELMPGNLARKINSFPEPVYLCDPRTSGYDYFGIEPSGDDVEIVKNTYNAFLSSESHSILKEAGIATPLLQDVLQVRGIQHLVFTGVLTARCVQTSLLGAVERGYDCVVPFDLVAMPAGPLQIKHFAALSEMATLYAEVTRADKITFQMEEK